MTLSTANELCAKKRDENIKNTRLFENLHIYPLLNLLSSAILVKS